jgi:hypothetical protein
MKSTAMLMKNANLFQIPHVSSYLFHLSLIVYRKDKTFILFDWFPMGLDLEPVGSRSK